MLGVQHKLASNSSEDGGEPRRPTIPANSSLFSLVYMMGDVEQPLDASAYSAIIQTLRTSSALPDLVDALISRYNAPPPPVALQEDLEEWNNSTKVLIRLRIIHFVMAWIEHHWVPGVDNEVFPALKTLVYQSVAELGPLLGDHTKEIVRARIQSMENVINRRKRLTHFVHISTMLMGSVPSGVTAGQTFFPSLQPSEFDKISFLDLDPIELARQLTIMESELYCAIRPEDLLQEDFVLFSSFRAIEAFGAQITSWVLESILKEVQLVKGKKFIEFILSVADACTQLYNYSTSSSILAAFNKPDISRLSQTFATLNETATYQLESLRTLMDPSGNYIEYRERIRATVPPAVPCLALYVADVTICGESYCESHIVNEWNRLVHFQKYTKFSHILREMQRFQTPYPLIHIPKIQDYLRTTLNDVQLTDVPAVHQTSNFNFSLKSVRSSLTTSSYATTSLYSIYSIASTSTISTDYGLYYTRHAISQDGHDDHAELGF